MKLALIQMPVAPDKEENLARACAGVRRAAEAGAQLAVLPEMFCCPYDNEAFVANAEEEGGPAWQAMSGCARECGVYLVAGSMPEECDGELFNTSYVFAPDGGQIAKHRKVHLFDVDIEGGQRFYESDTFAPGYEPTVFDTEFGTVGLCVCFDMRFPELARMMALMDAQVIIAPAAFNMTTGPMHWELTFRARAVDNQVFTVGVAPARDEGAAYVSYGNSIAVSPWGEVLYRAGAEEALGLVELDLDQVYEVRRQLPLLGARRDDIY